MIGEDWIETVSEGIKAVREEISAKVQSSGVTDALDQRRFRARLSTATGRLAEQAANAIRSWHREKPSRRSLEALVQLYWHSGNYAKALETLTSLTRERIAKLDTTPAQDIPNQALLALCDQQRNALIKACVYSGGDFFGSSLFGKHPSDWHIQPRSVDRLAWKWKQGSSIALPDDLGSDVAQLYDDALAGKEVIGRRIGELEIMAVYKSYTALRAFHVKGPDGESFLKVMPNDPARINHAGMAYGVEVAAHLQRGELLAAAALPVSTGTNPFVYENARIVATREAVAPGESLDHLAAQGAVTEAQLDSYIRAILAAAVKGADLGAQNPDKPPVRTTEEMHKKLTERSQLGRSHLEIFGRCPSQQAGQQAGRDFHDALESYIGTTWATGDNSTSIKSVGLVHDAIFRNAFLSKNKKDEPLITLIDFGDDYIGPVGHAISIMMTQLMSENAEWTFEQFRARALSLIEEYGHQSGRELNEAAKSEIVRDMAYHPYKFISSDGKQIMAQARTACGLTALAADDELASKMSDATAPVTQVDELLQNKGLADKYCNQIRVMQASLRLLLELDSEMSAEQRTTLERLIKAIDEVLRVGIRVALLEDTAPASRGRINNSSAGDKHHDA